MKQKTDFSNLSFNLEDYLQTKIRQSYNHISALVPSALKRVSNKALDQFSTWMISKLSSFEHAKIPTEGYDRAFYNSILELKFQDLLEENYDLPSLLNELNKMQGLLGKLTASPYLYNDLLKSFIEKLKDINAVQATEVEKVLQTFSSELQDQQEFTLECFSNDLADLLSEWCNHKTNYESVIDFFDFYQSVLNVTNNRNILFFLKSLFNKNEEKLKQIIGEQEFLNFDNFLSEKFSHFANLKAEETPEENKIPEDAQEEIESDEFEEIKKYDGSYLIANLGKIFNYALNHSFQALTVGLFAQVTASAAFGFLLEDLNKKGNDFHKRINSNDVPPESQVNDQSGNCTDPKVVVNGQKYSFAYTAPGDAGDGTDIFVREYDQLARPLGASFKINNQTSYDQGSISVTCSGTRCRALWQSMTPTMLNDIIYGEFDTNWTSVRAQSTFNTFNSMFADQGPPQLVSLPTGGSYGMWSTTNMDGSGKGINGRLIDPSGAPVGSDATVNSFISSDQDKPCLVATNTKISGAWQSATGIGHVGRYGIRGTNVFFNGTVQSPDSYIGDANDVGHQTNPSLGTNGTATLLTYDFGNNIRGRFLNENLQPLGPSFQINTDTNGVQTTSNIALLPNKNFLVTYSSNSTGTFKLMGQEVTSTGIFVGSEIEMNVSNAPQSSPSVQAFSQGDPKNFVLANTQIDQGVSSVVGRPFNSSSLEPLTTGVPIVTTNSLTTDTQTTGANAGTSAAVTSSAPTSSDITSQGLTTNNPSTTNPLTTNLPQATTQEMTSGPAAPLTTHSAGTTNALTSSNPGLTTSPDFGSQGDSSSEPKSNTALYIGLGTTAAILTTIGGVAAALTKYFYGKDKQKKPEEHQLRGIYSTSTEDSFGPNDARGMQLNSVRVDATRTTIGDYVLLNKLDERQAQQLYLKTGIKISFPPGKKKVKYDVFGHGKFGKIKYAENIKTKELVAVKKVKGKGVEQSLLEPELHKKLSGQENIIELLSAEKTHDSEKNVAIYEFMPLAGFGNGDFLQKSLAKLHDENLKQAILIDVLYQYLNGLNNMHKNHISHNDSKKANIVFERDGTLKIIDFGCASEFTDPTVNKELLGDNRYFSPERYKSNNFNVIKSDIWSAGLAVLEIALNREVLPRESNILKIYSRDENFFKEFFAKIPEMKNPKKGSVYEILQDVLNPDVNARLDIESLMEKMQKIYNVQKLDKTLRAKYYEDLFKLGNSSVVSTPVQNSVERDKDYNYRGRKGTLPNTTYNTSFTHSSNRTTPMWAPITNSNNVEQLANGKDEDQSFYKEKEPNDESKNIFYKT